MMYEMQSGKDNNLLRLTRVSMLDFQGEISRIRIFWDSKAESRISSAILPLLDEIRVWNRGRALC